MLKISGFTLLECLIATIIVVGGVIAIIGAFSTGMYATTDIENVEKALNIGQTKMEEIKNTAFGGIVDSPAASDPNFPDFTVDTDVAVIVPDDLKEIDVTVSWSVKGGTSSITLTTLVANYG